MLQAEGECAFVLKYRQIHSKSNFIHTDFRPGDVLHSLADISEARKNIGYDPKVNVKKGLAKTVEWFVREFYRK